MYPEVINRMTIYTFESVSSSLNRVLKGEGEAYDRHSCPNVGSREDCTKERSTLIGADSST